MKSLRIQIAAVLGLIAPFLCATNLHAQGTAFTYQGRLIANGSPANGLYDFLFSVFDVPSGGVSVGSGTVTNGVPVTNGLFAVKLDDGPGVYTGGPRWLSVAVSTNGLGSYTTLLPRQQILPTPYAITASNLSGTLSAGQLSGTISSGQLSGIYSGAITFNNAGNSFVGSYAGNGANVTNLNATNLTSGTVPSSALNNAWKLGGNAGTTAGTDFIGTTDNQALEFKVSGQRVLRLEPIFSGPNVIGGYNGNAVSNGFFGATIAGGGIIGAINRVDNYYATVGGGIANIASGVRSTVAGGHTNLSSGDAATVSGGLLNVSSGAYASVPGGYQNLAQGDASFAAGWRAKALHAGAFVWADSSPSDFSSTGGNQFLIRAGGGVGIGINAPQQHLSVDAGMNIDQNNVNNGTIANSLIFGSFSGEAIASKRTAGGNQYGMDFYTSSASRMSIANGGNVGIGTNAPSEKLHVVGNFIRVDGGGNEKVYMGGDGLGSDAQFGSLSSTITDAIMYNPTRGECMNLLAKAFIVCSDRNIKDVAGDVHTQDVLNKVLALPVQRWNYKGENDIQHIGPMAQDFRAAFGLGKDDKHIATVDADGVALAAIQGLNQKLTEELKRRDAENAELKQRLEKLERLIVSKGL